MDDNKVMKIVNRIFQHQKTIGTEKIQHFVSCLLASMAFLIAIFLFLHQRCTSVPCLTDLFADRIVATLELIKYKCI